MNVLLRGMGKNDNIRLQRAELKGLPGWELLDENSRSGTELEDLPRRKGFSGEFDLTLQAMMADTTFPSIPGEVHLTFVVDGEKVHRRFRLTLCNKETWDAQRPKATRI